MLLSACGSGDDEADDGTVESAETESGSDDASGEDEGTDSEAGADEGTDESASEADTTGASITLTLDDGTVYEIVDISSCETSATDPSGLPLPSGYDLTGRTSDGAIRFQATRAGFDEDGAIFSGVLEGEFDDEGQNATMLYALDGTGLELSVDGATVSGAIASKAVAPTRPHGDNPLITVDATC
jgi:hypothetical protein